MNSNSQNTVDVQGHRGCRGLMPENTVPAFLKALDLGVNTLELDVTVTKSGSVFVSHEPFFNHEISTKPDGTRVIEEEQFALNMYMMTDHEIQSFDVGLATHPRFPLQKKIPAQKPLLNEMVQKVETYLAANNLKSVDYNIEIKRHPKFDTIYHPEMDVFADVVCSTIIDLEIAERTILQCFDAETLNYVDKKFPTLKTAFLIENKESIEQNLAKLDFKPDIYSPDFQLLNEKAVHHLHTLGIDIIPWTVNEVKDIEYMLDLKVDGIISDYPDRLIEIVTSRQQG